MTLAETSAYAPPVSPETDALVRSMGIPPRPQTLTALEAEIGKDDPDFPRIATLVASDVALAAARLRIVNSPAYALSSPCTTIEQAVAMVGLRPTATLVSGLLLRKVLRTDGPQADPPLGRLEQARFCDVTLGSRNSKRCR